jgi:hypothetical protein
MFACAECSRLLGSRMLAVSAVSAAWSAMSCVELRRQYIKRPHSTHQTEHADILRPLQPARRTNESFHLRIIHAMPRPDPQRRVQPDYLTRLGKAAVDPSTWCTSKTLFLLLVATIPSDNVPGSLCFKPACILSHSGINVAH